MSFRVEEEVGPVWIRLHVPELKDLPQAQDQDLLTNLTETRGVKTSERLTVRVGFPLAAGTWFRISCGRSVALSRGKPRTRVAVSTWRPLSSSMMSGTWKNGWSCSSSLTQTQVGRGWGGDCELQERNSGRVGFSRAARVRVDTLHAGRHISVLSSVEDNPRARLPESHDMYRGIWSWTPTSHPPAATVSATGSS